MAPPRQPPYLTDDSGAAAADLVIKSVVTCISEDVYVTVTKADARNSSGVIRAFWYRFDNPSRSLFLNTISKR
jgi:hypothetical protein